MSGHGRSNGGQPRKAATGHAPCWWLATTAPPGGITDPWDIADWYLVPSPPMTRPASTLFTLYYWPIPGRGVFVSSLFAFTNTALHEARVDEIVRIKSAPPAEQPIPLRAPPFLVDHGADDFATSQLPAVAFYAASKLDLMPTDLQRQSLALKALEAPPHRPNLWPVPIPTRRQDAEQLADSRQLRRTAPPHSPSPDQPRCSPTPTMCSPSCGAPTPTSSSAASACCFILRVCSLEYSGPLRASWRVRAVGPDACLTPHYKHTPGALRIQAATLSVAGTCCGTSLRGMSGATATSSAGCSSGRPPPPATAARRSAAGCSARPHRHSLTWRRCIAP